MEELSIPKRRRPGLALIQRLTDPGAREICSLLDGGEKSALSEAEAMKPNSSFANLSTQELESLVSAVAELYRVRSSRNAAISEFAQGVTDAMIDIEEEEHRIPELGREEFKKKLEIILGAQELDITSKAKNLAVQDERTFCSARIMTELRPVFDDGSDAQPKAMVLVHRLKILYHAGSSDHKELYLALDADDLKELRKLITRAEAEAKSIESILPDFRLFGVAEADKK